MDERMRFVARLSDGEKMAVLCREFDISYLAASVPGSIDEKHPCLLERKSEGLGSSGIIHCPAIEIRFESPTGNRTRAVRFLATPVVHPERLIAIFCVPRRAESNPRFPSGKTRAIRDSN